MRSLRHRGAVAMENEELEQQANQVPTEEPLVDGGAENLESELLEVADAQDDVEAEEDTIEEADDTIEALESIRIDLKAALEEGGLTRSGASLLQKQLDRHYDRVGLRVQRSTPAMESFGGSQTRVQATKLAMESVGENIKKVWDSIVAALKRSIDWIVNLFQKIFASYEKIEERAKALAEKASKTDGEAKGTIDLPRLVKALHLGGKVPADASGAQALQAVAEGLFKGYAQAVKKIDDLAGSIEKATKGEEVSWPELSKELGEAVMADGLAEVSAKQEGFDVGEGTLVLRSRELPGGKAAIVILPQDEKNTGGIKAGVFEFSPKAGEGEGDCPVLAPKVAQEVAEIVGKIASEAKGRKGDLDKAKAVKNRLVKAANALGKSDAGSSKAAKDGILGASKLVDQPFASFNIYGLNTSKALLDQVEMSLKKVGGAAEAKPEDKKD